MSTPEEGDQEPVPVEPEPVLDPKEQFLADLQSGGTVELSDDISLSSSVPVTQDTIIDLNGHTIEAALSSALFGVDGAKLTLRGNGTVQNNKWIGSVTNGGRVTIDGGNYVSQNEAFYANNGGTIIFNGGHISSVECALNAGGNAVVEMNGGTIETSDNMGIATNGSSGRGGNTITMNGGTIDANIRSAGFEAIGVYIANSDKFVMNDGEIIANGGTGLCMRAGEVEIHGGKITATKTNKAGEVVPDGKIADRNSAMVGCAAIIYDEAANYPAKAGMKLTVDGGIITGVDHSVQVLSSEETPQVFVTGGTFTPAYPAA